MFSEQSMKKLLPPPPSLIISNYIMLEFRWTGELSLPDIIFANLLPLSFYILHLHGKHISLKLRVIISKVTAGH